MIWLHWKHQKGRFEVSVLPAAISEPEKTNLGKRGQKQGGAEER